jgi:hypothetical protein
MADLRERLPPGFEVNDLGDDPALLAAFDILMMAKALPDTKRFADRAAAMTLLREATDRACASSRSERDFPARLPQLPQATVSRQ